MNTTDNKVLMTTKENKKKSNYFCSYFKIKRRVAKAIATAMCAVMCVTSVDLTAFAVTGDAGSDINIVSVDSLSDEIANQKVKPGATLEDIIFPASLDVHVIDSDDKDIEVETKEGKATPTATPSATPTPTATVEPSTSAEPTPSVVPTPSAEVESTEAPQGEDVDVPEEINEEGNQESNEPEQNVPTEAPTEEGNQPDDTQNENTQNNNTQGEDAESQPDGEQIAKITNCGYDIETVYVPMEYCATEPSEEEVVVETLEKDDVDEELSNGENSENNTATKKEIVNEEIEEDVTVSVEWSIDEEHSSKKEFKDLEAGEEYIFVPTITEDGYRLAEEAELPVIKVTVEDGKAAAFEQSITVDGVVITVMADEGVFPEGTVIEARKVTTSEENEATEAIDEVRDEEKNVAVSYTFDITAYDQDGNEIEPDTSKGSVKVTFKMAEIANENLETDVYHLEETDDGLTAESLTVITEEIGNGENGEDENRKDKAENTENGNEENVEDDDAETSGKADDEVTVQTTGFSFYTVEFTYGELQYVLEGDAKVALSEILEAVEIKENGEISKVEGSDDELFKPVFDEEENAWYIESLKAFSSKEWLKVTIDEIEYEIVVTDDQAEPGDWNKLQSALNGTLTESVDGQLEISSGADETIIRLLTDFTAKTGSTSLEVSGIRTLDLNGYTINGKISDSESVGSVIKINSGAQLILTDSSTDKTGKITGGNAGNGGGVYNSGTFTMNGGTISQNSSTDDGGGVCNSGTFIMNGGILTGNKASSEGGGVYSDGDTFSMTGGTITGNEADGGGGVAVHVGKSFSLSGSGQITGNTSKTCGGGVLNKGSFTMSGSSKIDRNIGTAGGGVYNYGFGINANFTMESGIIEGNTAKDGGGIYNFGLGVNANFTMKSGIIEGNTAKDGGGIYNLANATFTIIGGEIKGNTASRANGGVFLDSTATLKVGGTAVIANNKLNDTENNVNLSYGQTITIADGDGVPTDGMKIRVTIGRSAGPVTGERTGQYARYFGSDDVTKAVVNKNDQVQIVSKDSVVACVNHDGTLTYCDSLQDAVNAAVSGDTAQLLRDIEGEDISVDDAKEITLDLNGKVLKGTGTKSVVTINDNAELTLEDSRNTAQHYDSFADLPAGGVITGGNTSHGGGVLIMGGSFTMNAGTICQNIATDSGSGVCVGHSGKEYTAGSYFFMNGGTITENTGSYWGGGVCVGSGPNSAKSYFSMNGGLISENTSADGGGVHVGGTGSENKFNMCGGTISGNISNGTGENDGGGGVSVYLYNPATSYYFYMSDGTITGNTSSGNGGGVHIRKGSGNVHLIVGGTAKIIDNKKGDTVQNVYLGTGETLSTSIIGEAIPRDGMKVGVTLESGTGYVTDIKETGQYAKYFTSDNENYQAFAKDDKVYIGVAKVLNKNTNTRYETITEAISKASAGDEIQLLVDITENVTVNKSITLDLNGKVLKGTGNGSVVTVSQDNVTFGLIDSRSTELHYFTYKSADAWSIIDSPTPEQKAQARPLNTILGDTTGINLIDGSTVIAVPGGVITGGNVKNNSGKGGGVNVATASAIFTMNGGNIVGNKSTVDSGEGGGVYTLGTFNFSNGYIAGCAVTNNGCDGGIGAYESSAVVNMKGGTVAYCYAVNAAGTGGGVRVTNGGTLNFSSGAVVHCSAKYVGGIHIHDANITMTGGTIAYCNCNESIGGLSVSGDTSALFGGGSVTNNTGNNMAGGVYLDTSDVTLGGSFVVKDNKLSNGTLNNLNLNGKKVKIALQALYNPTTMDVGVTAATNPTVTAPVDVTVTNDADYSRFFKSDNADYAIRNVDNVVKLMKAGTITNRTPVGDKDTNHGYITVSKTSAFGGDTVEVTVTPETGYVLKTLTYNTNPIARDTSGKYSFAMPNADVEVTAAFEVARGTSVVVTPPTAIQNLKYTGSAQQLVTAGEAENGTMYYAIGSSSTAVPTEGWSTSVPTGISAGTYYVWYKSMGDPGYIDSTPECVQATIANRTPDPTPAPDPGPDPQPTPNPSPEPDDPVVTPTAAPKGAYAETGLATKRYVPNGGTTAGIGNIIGTTANGIPLPYVTSNADKAGWTSIDQALVAYKKTKASKTEPFSVTMNGYATVDNQLLSDVYTQKVDLGLNLDNDVVVIVPKENNVISDAIKEWDATHVTEAGARTQLPAAQASSAQAQQKKLSDDVYFRVSAITTGDAKSNRMNDAGLDIKDILAIGGDANTPVIKVVASNKAIGLSKNRMIQLIFDTTKMTVKYKPGDTVYLYTGSAKAGVGCYTVGKVDKNGKVSFWVPMVSNYWTIGNKNLGTQIRKH